MCYKDWDGRSNSMVDCGDGGDGIMFYVAVAFVLYLVVMSIYKGIEEFIVDYKFKKEEREKDILDKEVTEVELIKNICQCYIGQPYLNINCEHRVVGGNLERKGIVVAKKCFVHDSWRIYDGADDSKEYTEKMLLQLDKDISDSFDAKFKQEGIK